MSKSKHADLKLRAIYDKYYEKTELARGTLKLHNYVLNKWERETDNPPVGEITNETLAEFRQRLLDSGLAPKTINNYWGDIRSFLRRIGPQEYKNPWGAGILQHIPQMKTCKVIQRIPQRVSLENLSRFYIATKNAQKPRRAGFPPAYFWQTLIVLAYFTGLRKGDLLKIEMNDIDLDAGILYFRADKTTKPMEIPLHPVAIVHIQRIWTPRKKLLLSIDPKRDLYEVWNGLMHKSNVTKKFSLKTIRGTACSEVERVKSGMGAVMLQHRSDVTSIHYLNQVEELGDAIQNMRVPIAFKHGIKMADRAEKKEVKESIRMHSDNFALPRTPEPDEWKFSAHGFCFHGKWYILHPVKQRNLLKLLAEAGKKSVTINEIAETVFGWKMTGGNREKKVWMIHNKILKLRRTLRNLFAITARWNPIPCVQRSDNSRWVLYLPPSAGLNSGNVSDANSQTVAPMQLRMARHLGEITQRELADNLGIKKNHKMISDLELGKLRITEEMSERLRKVLGSHLDNEFGRAAT